MITGLGPEWRHRTLLREINERIFALTQEFAPNPGGDLPIMVFCIAAAPDTIFCLSAPD